MTLLCCASGASSASESRCHPKTMTSLRNCLPSSTKNSTAAPERPGPERHKMAIELAPQGIQPAPQWHDLDADRTPRYIQVARELRTRIESGDYYQPGEC